MNYELSKKLKEAGFPLITTSSGKIWIGEDWLSPTLPELIEACGMSFKSLKMKGDWAHNKIEWFAQARGKKDGSIDSSLPDVRTRGKTPEEAVANLWLKLNKKHE